MDNNIKKRDTAGKESICLEGAKITLTSISGDVNHIKRMIGKKFAKTLTDEFQCLDDILDIILDKVHTEHERESYIRDGG